MRGSHVLTFVFGRSVLAGLALGGLTLGGLGCSGSDAPCEPACRDGFACVHGACVSACNPACAPGERCTAAAECVPDILDAAAPVDTGGLDTGTGAHDGGALPDTGSPGDDAFSALDAPPVIDAASVLDAGPPRCDEASVLCGGVCVAPTTPELGVRTPTTGTYGNDMFYAGDLAVDPCTGTMGLAYAQQISRSDNDETFLMILAPTLAGAPIGPIRVTTAPGPATSAAIAWARDRFFVFWSDPRHDPAPETCTRCLSELYVAAYDRDGTVVTPETRLTTSAGSTTIASLTAVAHPSSGEVLVAWTDSGDRQVHAGIVGPSGAMRDAQVVSEAVSPQRGNSPFVVWNDGWTILYRHDDPDGARPDYLHARTLASDGTLGADVDLRVPAEQIALASRGALGHATITTGGSALALRLWDPSWTATTTLPITSGTFDGSRGLGWDGTSLFFSDTSLSVSLVRLNALGTETGRVALTSDVGERSTNDLTMHLLGGRAIFEWVYATTPGGSVVHHRIEVRDTSF
jgi:hypothetical protein